MFDRVNKTIWQLHTYVHMLHLSANVTFFFQCSKRDRLPAGNVQQQDQIQETATQENAWGCKEEEK